MQYTPTGGIKEIKLSIGQLTKTLRKREGITQEALADLLGMSRITVQNLESGKNFTIDTLLKVIQHFDLLHEINKLLKEKQDELDDIDSLY